MDTLIRISEGSLTSDIHLRITDSELQTITAIFQLLERILSRHNGLELLRAWMCVLFLTKMMIITIVLRSPNDYTDTGYEVIPVVFVTIFGKLALKYHRS